MTFPNVPGDPVRNIALQMGHDDISAFHIAKVDSDGLQHMAGYVWNSSTLAWESMTQPVISSDVLNVTTSPSNLATAIYEDGDVMYVCKAAIGSALNSAVWQISKVDTTSGVVIQWCDSNANFDNTATDLATVQGHTYG
jgi:hypothetical protein